jgi:hypothetical protein
MAGLLIIGTLVFCGGVLTVVWGVPIKDFSFGNTLILVGAVVSCTGLLLIGLSLVIRELKNLSRELAERSPADIVRDEASVLSPRSSSLVPSLELPKVARPVPPRPAPSGGFLFPRDQPHGADVAGDEERPASAASGSAERDADDASSIPPWRSQPSERARTTTSPMSPKPAAEAAEPAADAPAERPRRNFLFSSRRRPATATEPPQDATLAAGELPDLDAARAATDQAEQPDRFDSAWPQAERPRLDADQGSTSRANGAGRFQPFRRSEEPSAPSVTVVKSGVVDAMAYSLYSDGSIEAQMPEGMVRFVSIDELRAHLGRRE